MPNTTSSAESVLNDWLQIRTEACATVRRYSLDLADLGPPHLHFT